MAGRDEETAASRCFREGVQAALKPLNGAGSDVCLVRGGMPYLWTFPSPREPNLLFGVDLLLF